MQKNKIVLTATVLRADPPFRVILLDPWLASRAGLENALANFPELELAVSGSDVEDAAGFEDFKGLLLAVVSVRLSEGNGILAGWRLTRKYHGLRLLLLCDQDWDIYLVIARGIGAAGILLRTSAPAYLVSGIQSALRGSIFTVEQLARILVWKEKTGRILASFKPHEWRVLWQVAAGLSNQEIAKKLDITPGTVEKYVSHILERTMLNSRSALVVFIYQNHLDVLAELPDELRIAILKS